MARISDRRIRVAGIGDLLVEIRTGLARIHAALADLAVSTGKNGREPPRASPQHRSPSSPSAERFAGCRL
jgi:hypothetical protein